MAHNRTMFIKWKLIVISICVITSVFAVEEVPMDSFYDVKTDYSVFSGRISDKDDSGHIIKVSSENDNIKFFRAGDPVEFRVARLDRSPCHGHVRSVEPGYFILYVRDYTPCWGERDYFRRGSALVFKAKSLHKRIESMGRYRVVLLRRKTDFLKQLNGINSFLWGYNQKKVHLATDYDKKIMELENQKQKALEGYLSEREDQILLQRELIKRIENVDKDLEFYRIGKTELYDDRWHMDLELGLPVKPRPQLEKDLDAK